ncbi:hypothetical protein ABFX02_06G189400 [Erythranthe guttata]
MHDFSTVDGFVKITEDLADMLKFVANEPSVGLYYIQQHTQNAVPNILTLKNNIVEKSHEASLRTEDLEDSITMLSSMKECGFPIADDMIKDIKKSLSIISTKQPKRGLIYNNASSGGASSAGFLGRTSSWSPATWGRNTHTHTHAKSDGSENSSGYLSSVFKSAKKRANSFKLPQMETNEASVSENEKLLDEDLPLSSEIGRELLEDSRLSKSLSDRNFISYENFDEFKADREAKLEEWLDGAGK